MAGTNIYVVVSSVVFPVLACMWLCCLAVCIYKSLVRTLRKNSTEDQSSNTSIQVKVRKASLSNLFFK